MRVRISCRRCRPSALARTVFAHSCSRRSGAAAAARATRLADGWPVEEAGKSTRAPPALSLTFCAPGSAGAVGQQACEDVVGNVSAHHQGTAEGPSRWTFEMICAADQSSDVALDAHPRRTPSTHTLDAHPRACQSHPARGASTGGLPAGRALDLDREASRRRAAHRDQRDVVSHLQGSARCGRTGGTSADDLLRFRWG